MKVTSKLILLQKNFWNPCIFFSWYIVPMTYLLWMHQALFLSGRPPWRNSTVAVALQRTRDWKPRTGISTDESAVRSIRWAGNGRATGKSTLPGSQGSPACRGFFRSPWCGPGRTFQVTGKARKKGWSTNEFGVEKKVGRTGGVEEASHYTALEGAVTVQDDSLPGWDTIRGTAEYKGSWIPKLHGKCIRQPMIMGFKIVLHPNKLVPQTCCTSFCVLTCGQCACAVTAEKLWEPPLWQLRNPS